MNGASQNRTVVSKWRSLFVVGMVNVAVLAAFPQSSQSNDGEGTLMMLPEMAPRGFLIEGRYADDPNLRLIKAEPLINGPMDYRMSAF